MSLVDEWGGFLPELLPGLWVSLRLTAFILGFGLPLGFVLALAGASRVAAVRLPAIALVEIGRGMPALVMLQLIYFGLPSSGLTLSAFLSAGFALALTTGAYSSEIIRAGLQSVPQGEVEAASALGMSQVDCLRYILVPQGLRIAVPALMGFGIIIFQATALAYTIALRELLAVAYSIGSATYEYLSVLALAGLLYAAITVPASFLTDHVERRLSRHV